MAADDADYEKLITDLYAALQARDGSAMANCYHSDAHFSDPVFVDLYGAQVKMMWKMLCARANDIRVQLSDVSVTERAGTASWQAWYTFSGTGRRVHNVVHASYEFRGGQIVRHVDSFSLWRWARQALGVRGFLLAALPPVQAKIRAEAMARLAKWPGG
jgi:ketosteroid isomerase-like protein